MNSPGRPAAETGEHQSEWRGVPLKLQQLRYLLAIVDNGLNVTAAANQLETSQPGVSRQVGLLEEELGEAIFTRHGRRLTAITPKGRRIVMHARAIMAEVDCIRRLTSPEHPRRVIGGC